MTKAFLFDLDGVLVDTASFHYIAWKRLSNSLGFDIDEYFNESLKGISRMDSLDLILQKGNITITDEQKIELATQKNQWYLELVNQMTEKDILNGVIDFLKEAQCHGILIGLGSASKNAPLILEKVGIAHYFNLIVDGNSVKNSKPHPEVFLKGAKGLGLQESECIVFEDAFAGIEAAHAANMKAVGIGTAHDLPTADLLCAGLQEINVEKVINTIGK